MQAAKLVNHVVPVYPPNAEKQGIEGTVILRAVIGTNGQMLSLSPYNDADPSLTSAAMAAVGQWRYQPTLLNGLPVEVVTTITAAFRLISNQDCTSCSILTLRSSSAARSGRHGSCSRPLCENRSGRPRRAREPIQSASGSPHGPCATGRRVRTWRSDWGRCAGQSDNFPTDSSRSKTVLRKRAKWSWRSHPVKSSSKPW